jgi:hypothetical protein
VTAVCCCCPQVPRKLIGTDGFQETPIVEVTRAITKHNYLVMDIEDLPRVMKEVRWFACTVVLVHYVGAMTAVCCLPVSACSSQLAPLLSFSKHGMDVHTMFGRPSGHPSILLYVCSLPLAALTHTDTHTSVQFAGLLPGAHWPPRPRAG